MSGIVSIATTMTDLLLRRSLTLLVAFLVAVAVQAASPPSETREPGPNSSVDRPPDDSEGRTEGIIPFVVERFKGRNRYPGDEGKNHTMVKAAFRDVVADASAATVVVLADDKRVALGTIVSSDGYIVTKASELRGKITCKLDEKSYDARR